MILTITEVNATDFVDPEMTLLVITLVTRMGTESVCQVGVEFTAIKVGGTFEAVLIC